MTDEEEAKNEACKTYLEQTKLLITLASAFIIAPVAFFDKEQILKYFSLWMEACFVFSAFLGYVVVGTISGRQFKKEFNLYRRGTRIFSLAQIGAFFTGLIILLLNLNEAKAHLGKEPAIKPTIDTLSPYKLGEVVRIKNIYFDFDQWQLRPESFTELHKITDTLNKYPKLRIEINAHTDSVGNSNYNLTLSEKRAASVMQYIIADGIPANQIASKGYGETMPVTSNSTYEGRQMNRRIEFRVLGIN